MEAVFTLGTRDFQSAKNRVEPASLIRQEKITRARLQITVTLHGDEELQVERTGDLGEGNAGMLVFVAGRKRPEHLPWANVEQVAFDRPPTMYPPLR